MTSLSLNNDEIELACDALWYQHGSSDMRETVRPLWDRLQAVRTGDYGGAATIALSEAEMHQVIQALRAVQADQGLDPDEQTLLTRLGSGE